MATTLGQGTGQQMRSGMDKEPKYTPRQGQFLVFIHYYSKLNGCPPAEGDMARYFKITAPSTHQMVVTLEQRGLIERVSGQPRSIRVLLAREDLPDLA